MVSLSSVGKPKLLAGTLRDINQRIDKPGYRIPGFGEGDGSDKRSEERTDVVKSGAEREQCDG